MTDAGTIRGLVDAYGRPLRRAELTTPFEEPGATTAGVRQFFRETVANGLTPERLAAILRRAADDEDATDFLTLAEEMEERDGHYGSVLATRKSAVTNVDVLVEAAGEGAEEEEIADAIRAVVDTPTFIDAAEDMLDALGKGYSVVEIVWHTEARRWTPVEFVWRDPRFFRFDRHTRRRLTLRREGPEDGEELPAGKFIRHVPRIKSGLPIRQGLARLSAWAWLIKSYTLKDWMQFVDVFGMPLRIGRYDAQASETDKRALLRAVRSIAVDAAAIIPRSMEIEFQAVAGGRGEAVFGALADFVDRQMSKAVLGQTMTTDDGSSLAQAAIHNEVRLEIMKKDARQLANTINRDLVRPFVDLNFGPRAAYPQVRFPVEDPEDLDALSNQLARLVPLGLRVGQQAIRDRFGLPVPDDGEELLAAPGATGGRASSQSGTGDPATRDAARRRAPACPSCGVAHARAGDPATEDRFDQAGDDALVTWEEQLDPVVDPIRALAADARSADEFLARLPEVLRAMDAGPLTEAAAAALVVARGLGDVADRD